MSTPVELPGIKVTSNLPSYVCPKQSISFESETIAILRQIEMYRDAHRKLTELLGSVEIASMSSNFHDTVAVEVDSLATDIYDAITKYEHQVKEWCSRAVNVELTHGAFLTIPFVGNHSGWDQQKFPTIFLPAGEHLLGDLPDDTELVVIVRNEPDNPGSLGGYNQTYRFVNGMLGE